MLALANYFKSARPHPPQLLRRRLTFGSTEYSFWSKDIIFVVSDGYSEGAQAWLDAYHGYGQSSTLRGRLGQDLIDPLSSDLVAEPLELTTGPIWAALNLDYPHHSFSHIGIHYGESKTLALCAPR